MSYFVYILQSETNLSYYIGQTQNVESRIKRHNSGGSRYTKNRGPWKLVYQEKYQSRSEAMKREIEFKRQKSRNYLEQLIKANENC